MFHGFPTKPDSSTNQSPCSSSNSHAVVAASLPTSSSPRRDGPDDGSNGNSDGNGKYRSLPSPALVEPLAGLTAGTVATLAVHPLDIVKTRMQVHRTAGPSSPTPPTALSVLRSLLRSPRPVASLYRGLAPNLIGNAASWGSFFFFKARFEGVLLSRKQRRPPPQTTQTSPPPAPRLSPLEFFLASAGAGATATLLTNPIWVLKTRLLSTDRGAAGAYPGFVSGVARLWRGEGWRGFYRGVGVSLLGVSHGAVQFAVYDPLRRAYLSYRLASPRRRQGKDTQQGAGGRRGAGSTAEEESWKPTATPAKEQAGGPVVTVKLDNEATVMISTVAKLVAGVATYPYQVLRSRMQHHEAEARFGRGVRGVAATVWAEEGFAGFYRGLVPGVVRVLPATWVMFLVYENLRFRLPRWMGDEGSEGRARKR